MLRVVAWTNIWDRGAALHSDVGSLIHLTETEGVTGKTLCGREFPADKGHPATGRVCKRCWNIAKKRELKVDIKQADWVPSREYS